MIRNWMKMLLAILLGNVGGGLYAGHFQCFCSTLAGPQKRP